MTAAKANKSTLAKTGEVDRKWHVVDATDQVLGRLASRIAMVLMGKHRPTYTPHVDTGDFVIVLNAGRVRITGNKPDQVVYQRFSGYTSGQKNILMKHMLEKHPERVLEQAVKGMLPKNKLGRRMLTKLKLFTGDTHPHQAQQPQPLTL